ncbi:MULTISPECIES: bifunctional fucokinase/fucose-1-phosphate guanylyltransferase [Bacteroidaceae]|jgi:bifunctional fucokinase/L-fucose-1-P-guanylyltransferase|uniref:Bifunctional fucokinase/L-fucose-1-P-guanylyltransferase n=3 Tax=Phocaeicola sartorii TaxID=671267 RepID=A0A4V3RSX8_9BACT|nr:MULTISPECIES: bifunctional fucokinase/fucose-1-phosphate guanylyltransferase [Bacteroidaceae]NBH66953.1 bifunctional fucokinase/L-fucose-1-P-guanylyltransferase [Phocaeicola sartorii]TGY68989.1 bifunctional fucokinase/L-fucose-1-P-guanylyltransferase [Phocaeicola sartorii]
MKKLLSLPPNLVECFHDIEKADRTEWFCTSDPIGSKLGSGGGTAWLLEACRQEMDSDSDFLTWLGKEKRILLHAGGQSRRLPGYAPSGKILTPVPVFRWARGQRLSQNLLSLQLPLYERIMEKAPSSLHTLIASGDVYIRAGQPLQAIPDADVVCYGLWVDPNLAKNHGVFVSSRATPDKLDFMLQKPSVEELGKLMQTHLFLMDIGIWLLSDRAVSLLVKRSHQEGKLSYYDMYSDFGLTLGEHPRMMDDELNALSVAILPLPGGEFYHYGTSRELISSTLAVQNLVNDQREIMHRKVKPHPAMFVQNAEVGYQLTSQNSEIWIENSCVGAAWNIHQQTIITGVPVNDWNLEVPSGVCIDVVPFGESDYVARPYGFHDTFKGALSEAGTCYQGMPVGEWCAVRGLSVEEIENGHDLQAARLFPVCSSVEELGVVMRWMVSEPALQEGKEIWQRSRKLSADEISAYADLHRLAEQREAFRVKNWPALAHNYERSVFYQLNLENAAGEFARYDLSLPEPLSDSVPLMTRISDSMFRARVQQLKGMAYREYEDEAFRLMRDGLTASALAKRQQPHLSVYSDQIVWGRSPVRIDLAGGWTDTPPYCLNEGGNVVNIAIELNGQPPLQVYVKPCREYKIILRSIDLGAMEEVDTYEELRDFMQVGSPFSIPKAALVLAGFQPGFSTESYASLEEQLKAFGSGMEITLLSAIPAGSGLGTSSILASTVLGAVADFCGLNWDKNEVCNRTLILEQLLTTGGGWQDQYGGVLRGVKLLQTHAGMDQSPLVRWLPDYLFTGGEYQKCHLLYYTGITRTAKGILAEIVRSMFLNSTEHLSILGGMKGHALDLYEAIQCGNFDEMGRLVGKSWKLNQALDPGTNPEAVEAIIRRIDDYCLGYKLPGAGGGGYLYMVAKDPEAAIRIRSILTQNPPNSCARFVDMTLSDKGLQISRS